MDMLQLRGTGPNVGGMLDWKVCPRYPRQYQPRKMVVVALYAQTRRIHHRSTGADTSLFAVEPHVPMKIAHVDPHHDLFKITADAYSRGEIKSDFEVRLKVELQMMLELRRWLCLMNNLNLKHALTSQFVMYYRAPSDHGLYKLTQQTIDHHLMPQLDFFRAAPIEIFIFHPHGTINRRMWRDAPWNAVSPYCQ